MNRSIKYKHISIWFLVVLPYNARLLSTSSEWYNKDSFQCIYFCVYLQNKFTGFFLLFRLYLPSRIFILKHTVVIQQISKKKSLIQFYANAKWNYFEKALKWYLLCWICSMLRICVLWTAINTTETNKTRRNRVQTRDEYTAMWYLNANINNDVVYQPTHSSRYNNVSDIQS